MAIKKNHLPSIKNLSQYYCNQIEYDDAIKYLLMGARHDDHNSKHELRFLCSTHNIVPAIIKLQIEDKQKIIKLKQKIKILEMKNDELVEENTHLKYMPNGIGYEAAKKNFESNKNLCASIN